MERVVIFGRGGAGKSVLARELGVATGLPVVELDKEIWSDQLVALPTEEWERRQAVLSDQPRWIMDGDLGPYDEVGPRLTRADTVVVLDLPLWPCAWRAWRRGPERRDCRPVLLRAIADLAPRASVVILRSPGSVRRWMNGVGS